MNLKKDKNVLKKNLVIGWKKPLIILKIKEQKIQIKL